METEAVAAAQSMDDAMLLEALREAETEVGSSLEFLATPPKKKPTFPTIRLAESRDDPNDVVLTYGQHQISYRAKGSERTYNFQGLKFSKRNGNAGKTFEFYLPAALVSPLRKALTKLDQLRNVC